MAILAVAFAAEIVLASDQRLPYLVRWFERELRINRDSRGYRHAITVSLRYSGARLANVTRFQEMHHERVAEAMGKSETNNLIKRGEKMRSAKNWKGLIFILPTMIVFCLCATSPVAVAQSSGTGAIAGTVMDPSGLAVIDAQVRVTNEATGSSIVVKSQSGGVYTASLLLPGTYTVEVSKAGFKEWAARGIRVNVTETAGLNIKLEVGAVTEKVIVSAQGSMLQTDSSSEGHVTSGEMIQNLPLATRNYTEIIALNPGVAADVLNVTDIGRGGYNNSPLVSGGAVRTDNNYQMNGLDVNDWEETGTNSGGVPIPNPDSIQEFRVQTSQYDATYGRDAGANVNVVTKSGTNQFHGNAWEYFRNTALNANDWFLNRSSQPKAVLDQNQFGADLGGPVLKDKLTFFTSYQGTRQKDGFGQLCSSTLTGLGGLTHNNRTAAGLGQLFGGLPDSVGNTVASDGLEHRAAGPCCNAIKIAERPISSPI